VAGHYRAGFLKLAADLNAEGPASWDKRWHRNGTSTRVPWSVTRLLRLVRNPLYKGVVVWGKDARSRRVQKLLATYQGTTFVHNADKYRIVDAAAWAACQGPKDGSPAAYRRGEGRHPRTVGCAALFGGLLRCPRCGGPMYFRNGNASGSPRWGRRTGAGATNGGRTAAPTASGRRRCST
jgi:hypothetical protein